MLKSEGGSMSCDDLRRDIAIALLMARDLQGRSLLCDHVVFISGVEGDMETI
jgi:hypothetical protein